MAHLSDHLRRFVLERAAGRCEYCRVAQVGQEATFHVDHVVPLAAGGATAVENLALACVSCSLRKAARRMALDPQSGVAAALFHPRNDTWSEHFLWTGVVVVGLTPMGRATIDALQLNRPLALAIREEESQRNRHPPPMP